jgi:hypothetical protein
VEGSFTLYPPRPPTASHNYLLPPTTRRNPSWTLYVRFERPSLAQVLIWTTYGSETGLRVMLCPARVKYECELEPLWLTADSVEKARDAFVFAAMRMDLYDCFAF